MFYGEIPSIIRRYLILPKLRSKQTLLLSKVLVSQISIGRPCETTSDEDIREILSTLPKDVLKTYGRIVTKTRAFRPGRVKTARQMFKWLLCAQRPLHIDELREVAALDLTDSHFDEDKPPSGDNWRLTRCVGTSQS